MIELKELSQKDCNMIFSWISNPELRKMTGTRGIPNIHSHAKWFDTKLNDKNNIIRMIVYENVSVGIIGTNEINTIDNNADIYLYIGNPLYRKKGIAFGAINKLIELLVKKYNCHKITATIRSYNEPSINLFTKCGFICEGIQKDQILYDDVYYDRMLFGKILD